MSMPPRIRILVVDDDAMVNQSIQNQLERLGLEVAGAAYDAGEALALTRLLHPDVVLMDMRMPDPETGMEDPTAGLSATRLIRDTCPTPVVLLTAYESPELIRQASEAGIMAYLLKPVKDGDLDRTVHMARARFSDVLQLAKANQELKERNEDLRRSEGLFRTLADAAPMGILKGDSRGRITYLSPFWARILGLRPEDLLGQGLVTLMVAEDRTRFAEDLQKTLTQGRSWTNTFRFQRPGGVARWLRLHAAPLMGASGGWEGFMAVADDITDRRQARELREQAQKRESLAVLTGGIAHDFNNLLSAVQGYLELAIIQAPEQGPLPRYLQGIQEAVDRAGNLVSQMLAFAGQQTLSAEPLVLNHLLEALKPTLLNVLPKDARLHYQLDPDLPRISADPMQLQQVVHCLVMNATEALPPEGGHVTVSTRLAMLDAPALARISTLENARPGPYLALSVQDTGGGMDAATLGRIFDPFFSTKFMGRGLGLPATQGILRTHRAILKVESEVDKGSTFTIYFPVLQEDLDLPEPAPLRKAQQPVQASSSTRILLVDDETVLRESVAEFLEILGFEVIQAVDGQDAVERFQAMLGHISLVIMDLTMPRMDGHEAFLALRALDPSLKVILSSGYTEQDATRPFQGAKLAAFLHKPYYLKDLEALIHRVLSEP